MNLTQRSVCRRGAVRLGISKLTQVDFVPKEMVSYSKETQTPTEAVAHTDQKAGKSHNNTPLLALLNVSPSSHVDVSDEEEDEEISAPPPVEGALEEKEEQGEQQVEGKNTNTGTTK